MDFRNEIFVLLSGGIDSTTVLYKMKALYGNSVHALSIDYGQRHKKEIEHAQAICMELGVPHKILDLKGVIPQTMLTNPHARVPDVAYDQLEGVSPTYVPFRNGLMISACASYIVGKYERKKAEMIKAGYSFEDVEWLLAIGAHAEDSANWAYPDCTPEFIGAMANAIYVGTYHQVRLIAPLQYMNKAEIIRLGSLYRVDWSRTWSCYKGLSDHCGVCPTCRARRAGFRNAGVDDPTTYAA